MPNALRTLLVPVEESDCSLKAIDFAIDLAGGGATIAVCSVADTIPPMGAAGMGTPVDATFIMDSVKRSAHRACENAVERARKRGVTVAETVLSGAVVPAILRHAAALHADAIVVGTHARSGAARLVLGSVAADLLQAGTIPVIVTHNDDASTQTGSIMVAIDSTPASSAALDVAIDLARLHRRPLSLIHVVPEGREAWAAAEAILDEAAERVRSAGLEFELVTMTGSISDTLAEVSKRHGVHMIVMGTHHRRWLHLHDVAAATVQRAHVPVMVVQA